MTLTTELEVVRDDARKIQRMLDPLFQQYGADLERIVRDLVACYGLAKALDWLMAYDAHSPITEAFRVIYLQEIKTHLHLCSGGCGQNFTFDQLRTLETPGRAGLYFCEACVERETQHEVRRLARRSIRSALNRARAARLPATLTEGQWKETLAFFNNACAYCGGPWYVVEHVIPIEQGGGTTSKNCVPSCFVCNTAKGPNTLATWQPNSPAHQVALRKWQDRE